MTALAWIGAIAAVVVVWGALALLVMGTVAGLLGIWGMPLWWWVAVLAGVLLWRLDDYRSHR